MKDVTQGRRNRLNVYTGPHFLSIRQFKRGGELLLDALSLFTATELLSHEFVGLSLPTHIGFEEGRSEEGASFFSFFCPILPSLTHIFTPHQRPRSESSPPGNTSPSQEFIRMPLRKIFRCPWCALFLIPTPLTLTIPFPVTFEQLPLNPYAKTFYHKGRPTSIVNIMSTHEQLTVNVVLK